MTYDDVRKATADLRAVARRLEESCAGAVPVDGAPVSCPVCGADLRDDALRILGELESAIRAERRKEGARKAASARWEKGKMNTSAPEEGKTPASTV